MTKRKKYRSRFDIAAAILKAALDGANQTRMMYLSFLSFKQIKDYLEVLVGSGLLERNKKMLTYRTTAKGRELLSYYESMKI